MKKFFLFFALFLLVGAGCSGGGQTVVDTNTSAWSLGFDLPRNWVMVKPYDETSQSVNTDLLITVEDSEVILQSTANHILAGDQPLEGDDLSIYGEVVTENFARVSVTRLDTRRLIPSEAEDLGDGWFVLQNCVPGESCQNGGLHYADYYLETSDAKYKFVITMNGMDVDDVVKVLMSAEVASL